MSDQQPTSWRDRFFGTAPDAREQQPEGPDAGMSHDSAELAPDSTEVAATSVDEHDAHQPLVEHEGEAEAVQARADADDREQPIEPTVIAPSTLRGPSHSAAHPDDAPRASADEVHGDAATTSLEREPDGDATEPPPLVEPRRPSFGLRRHGDGEAAGGAGAAAATAGAAAAGAAATRRERREFVEPEPTQAMDAHDATRPIATADGTPTRSLDATGDDTAATRAIDTTDGDATATRVLDEQPLERTGRFGIVRDEVPASSIPVDDETARAAAGGTPIVLVEEPVPPRRKGARGVGVAVVLLATVIFGLVLAAAFFAVGYLFDRRFDAAETLETLWLRPSYLLPVVVFLLAYLVLALIVNRAGWWAHVLGGFIVAALVYLAHIAGAFMESEGGWESYTALPGIDAASLSQLLLAPLSVLAFVIAREVPIWVGGIVSRRGRRAREWNRQAMDAFNAENTERLAAYERARG